jgi:hypothetical protein
LAVAQKAKELGLTWQRGGMRRKPKRAKETPMLQEPDSFAHAVRTVFGRYVSVRMVEALRLELIRAGLIDCDGQTPYEVGPPISPLHS